MRLLRVILCWSLLLATALVSLEAQSATPKDEATMARFEVLHDQMASSQAALEETTRALTNERERVAQRLDRIEDELASTKRDRPTRSGGSETDRAQTQRAHKEKVIEVKSRHLEALAEQHAIDVELFRAFEEHGSAILRNLEIYVDELGSDVESERSRIETGQNAMRTLQLGAARALASLEDWGVLTREDPRFAGLWTVARMLARTQRILENDSGADATAQAVNAQIFHVRSLLDQTRAGQAILEHEGLLLQMVAQTMTLGLLDTRMAAISGTSLPESHFEERIGRIGLILEEPSSQSLGEEPVLFGFDECANGGDCE
jgi:hypothetical protein